MSVILYSLVIISILPVLIAWIAGYYRIKQFGGFDNKNPRPEQFKLEGIGARAVAAQANAWEALILFTVSIFIAFCAGVDMNSLDAVGYAFVIARILHLLFYLLSWDVLRSVIFFVAWGACLYMIYLSMNVA